ncbi:unnamed protein product, partial [Linum tenue]
KRRKAAQDIVSYLPILNQERGKSERGGKTLANPTFQNHQHRRIPSLPSEIPLQKSTQPISNGSRSIRRSNSMAKPDTSPVLSPTSSRSVTQTVNGSHRFVIQGYSLAKGMGVGKHIASDNFTVGGYQWAIYFYPDGKNPEDNSAYVSVFIALASEGTDVRALFELTLVDQSGKGKHKVHSHFDRSLESGPYTLKYRGSMWGYKRFFRRAMLETSDYLKNDCLKINCTVGVVVSAVDCSRLHSIQVPESDIGAHFGTLLETMEGSDVTFNVAGEKFEAHKLVLAARSPIFRSKFFDCAEDSEEIVITDLEPDVFKAILHFIYRDTLTEDVGNTASSSSSLCSISESLTAKLLAAADRYGLDRLRLMCESHLCKDISVASVARILALADSYHATELKAVCLKFAAENLAAVMRSDGFEYLKENCPTLQSELLKTVAGCEDDCSSGGGKSRSVWGQLSDGGETTTNERRKSTKEIALLSLVSKSAKPKTCKKNPTGRHCSLTDPPPKPHPSINRSISRRNMLWCSYCLRLCSTMRQGDFISCSACGKVLADRTTSAGANQKMAVVKSGFVGSKRVCNDAAAVGDTDTDGSESDGDSGQSSS